jgi:putative alpha-1,2-mannosidase
MRPLDPLTRRTFLKGTGSAVAAVALPHTAEILPNAPQETPAEAPQDLADLVNLLQGTASTPEFSTGNTLPIAAMPFGMAHWTIQSRDHTPWFFQPAMRRIEGLRCTHQLSPWLGDYGHATFLPFRATPKPTATDRASSYRPEDARLKPYALDLFLLRYRTQVELVPTDRCCILQATFEDLPAPTPEPRGFILDIPKTTSEIQQLPVSRRIHFTSVATSGGTPANFATYYVVEFSQPWTACKIDQAGTNTLATITFSDNPKTLQARIATSFISFEQAKHNLDSELGTRSIEQLRDAAKCIWNTMLHTIEIATTPGDPDKGYGRQGIEQYLKLNYVPADQIKQSAAETVDAAFGDFCIAQVARALGNDVDTALFELRSTNWKRLFDKQTRFLRGRNADGSWLTPFDSFTWGTPYVEGSAWQHRWDAPPGMIALMGGPEASVKALEKMLAIQPIFNVGVYGEEIHEMSEMAAVPFGQYAQSNQPVHHLLYLFAHAGRPDRSQFWARRVMNELYTPDTFPGDEDTGSMAAWYVLSALGFYPTCPGKPAYTLGSPLFSKATIHLANAKTFVITARNNNPTAVFVKSTHLNGQPLTGCTLMHKAIINGGVLDHTMSTA